MKPELTPVRFLVTASITSIWTTGVTTVAGGSQRIRVATSAALGCTCSITVDAKGVIYISSIYRNRIFKVDTSGNILTVAGSDLDNFMWRRWPGRERDIS
jgi:hypothetical protein